MRTARAPESQVSDVEPVKPAGGGDTTTSQPTQGPAAPATEVRIRIKPAPPRELFKKTGVLPPVE